MEYLIIMVGLAAAGIARLWLLQRKQRARTQTVDGFWSSLERIEKVSLDPTSSPRRATSRPAGARGSARPGPTPLDPARRAAAKKRLEERRKARARARSAS